MLSFKALSEKKTKITINPKLKDVMEKKACNHTKQGLECPTHGMKSCPDTEEIVEKKTGSCGKPPGECRCNEKTPAQKSICPVCRGTGKKDGKPCPTCKGTGSMSSEDGMDEGYKGYSKGGEVEPPRERLKTDRNMFNIPKDEQDAARERLKAKAAAKRKQLNKEEQAYVSQEEVSEESDQSIDQEETSLLTFGQFTKEGLSIDDQMRISREYNRKSPEEKKAANKKAMGNVKKVPPKKDTRTDAQKMTDATGPRPGSRYRGD